jgi:hypothetical protein
VLLYIINSNYDNGMTATEPIAVSVRGIALHSMYINMCPKLGNKAQPTNQKLLERLAYRRLLSKETGMGSNSGSIARIKFVAVLSAQSPSGQPQRSVD